MAPVKKTKIGDAVWLRGAAKGKDPFVPANVSNVQQNGARITVKRVTGEEETFDTAKADMFPANEKDLMTNDHCALIHLNEPCVLENTRLRYQHDNIYTYTGKILVALNPFGPLKIYGADAMAKYKDKDIGAKGVDPHVYAMGEAAFKHVKRHKTPAALVMSGESGAGKTETTKHLMRYLAWRSEEASIKAGSGDKMDQLADAILSTNPLLESFGNAKTVRNNNSSRFGKMMRLHFDATGHVAGAFIKTYLLEKSRCVTITNPERSYHIFYQIMTASYPSKGDYVGKKKVEEMRLLNQSQCYTLTVMKDEAFHKEVTDAMAKLNIPSSSQTELVQVLAALLALGNVTFKEEDEKADIADEAALAAAEALLGAGKLSSLLTTRTMTRGGGGKRMSTYTIDYNKEKAEGARDAVIKAVYTKLFDWIVDKVNGYIMTKEESAKLPYVGLLDIFGFENFKHNSFEQLCINFANEKLQQFFLTCVFKEEEALHIKESVPWKDIEFQDNQGCIVMLEKPPNGVLRLLDSQCKAPTPTEQNFCKELNKVHAKADFIVPTRKQRMTDEEGFIVRHYAGDVVYHTAAIIGKSTGNVEVPWTDKNNDTLQAEWTARLATGEVGLLKEIFSEDYEKNNKDAKKAAFASVGKRFVTDLNNLLTELQTSKAAFIRCIKPNADQAAKTFTASMVLDQLRCSGVIEAVRVMLEAYPTRINYEDIHGRYAKLMGPEIMAETGDEPAAFCEAIAQACEVADADYALGQTKLFLKAGCGTFLEDLAAMDPAVVAPLLTEKIAQSKRKKGAASLVGNAVLSWYQRKKYKEQKKAAELAQHRLRTLKARREYAKWSKERQARLKKEAEERAKKEAAEKAAAEAAAKLKAEQEAELAKVAAAEQEKKKKEQEAAMAAAVEKAKAEAEAKLAAEMAAAEKAAEESAARDRAKFATDLARTGGGGEGGGDMGGDGYQPAVVSSGGRRKSFTGDMPRASSRMSSAGGANAAAAADGDEEGSPSLVKANSARVLKEELFDVTITREVKGGTLGIAVDLWDGEVTVGAISTNGPADKEGTLIQGDIIRAVDGTVCATIEEVTMCVIKGGIQLLLSICRRPVTTVLESEVKMKMPSGEWDPFAFRLLSNRNIEFEKLSPPQYTGEIHARLAHSLDLKDDGVDKVLNIETGHKTFELKAGSARELAQWHLRLQEVIMLQEKVANVAHGWLLKEEGGVGGTQLKHFWFVLFSNGILMHFSDPNRANLGQSLGFIPVEECVESSHSSKQHTLHIKCSFDQWLLATNSKENMLQWAASLHAAQPQKQTNKPVADLILAQGWLDVPREEKEEEIWIRHWFVLKNTILALYSEDMKKANDLSSPVVQLETSQMVSAQRAQGVDFYKWGIVLETATGPLRLRAVGQSEMRQLLSTLNVHCIEGKKEEENAEPEVVKSKAVIRSGYLYKKSLKQTGVRVGKAWQRRWFVLEVTTDGGEAGTVVRTGKLTYYQSNKDTKEGVEIPLHETMSVKPGLGKTKGTEHRITVATPKREFELGCDDKALAEGWINDCMQWIGMPKVERIQQKAADGEEKVVKSQWMEARVVVYTPDEISDEELARSNTIQKTVSSFGRSFTLTGKKKKPAAEPTPAASPSKEEEEEDDDDDEDDEEEAFNWVFIALMSDGTLRQYANELMSEEIARLKLGYLVQAEFLEDPPDTYEHAFRVKPESPTADSWILCPDSAGDSEEWIAVLKA